jgi:osmoprotectant transport system substrate-binding protein
VRARARAGLRLDITEDLPLGFGSVQNKQAVVEGKAQLGLSGTTDGTLGAWAWSCSRTTSSCRTPTTSSRSSTPRAGRLDEVAELLDSLSETLTTEDLAELNRRVDEDREQAADVAEDYLDEQGLLGG